jgi:hypothetical protein
MKNLSFKSGDHIRFDPSLSVMLSSESLFKTPRVPGRISRVEPLHLEEPAMTLPSWQIDGEDGSVFLLVEDKAANLWFLLRLMAESSHPGGMPAWVEQDDYAVAAPGGQTLAFDYYSPPMLGRLAGDNLLLRVYIRPVEDSEEFLWVILRNDTRLEHWIGIVIDPAQLLPG